MWEGGCAEEILEAGFADSGGWFVVDYSLVVCEDFEFFFGEGVGFESYFEVMFWFWRGFEVLFLGLMDTFYDIEICISFLGLLF